MKVEDMKIISDGYAENKTIFEQIKKEWREKNPSAKVKRVRTDTKGLIMYWVVVEQ